MDWIKRSRRNPEPDYGSEKEGKTILLTSHNSEDICVLADVVWEMDGGCLIH